MSKVSSQIKEKIKKLKDEITELLKDVDKPTITRGWSEIRKEKIDNPLKFDEKVKKPFKPCLSPLG